MSQTRNIQIIYHNDPMDPDNQVYNYQITLGPDDGSDQNYFTGQEQAVQMQGLANALNSALPQTSVIVSVNGHDFKVMPKQDFISMLIRKDDYVSVVLFGTGDKAMEQTSIKAQNINSESSVAPTDESKPVQSNKSQEQQAAKTAKDYAYPRIIEYQSNGKGRYKPLNLNTGDTPKPTDKIKQIGMSELGTPIYWQDLEKILDKESHTLFNNPLGVIPANGSVTPRRRHTFAKLSGLEENALDNFETRELTMFSDDNGKSMYKLVVFTDPAPTQENKNQTEESNDSFSQDITNEATDIVNTSNDDSSLRDQSLAQAANTLANAMENYQTVITKRITKLEETNAKLSTPDTTDLPEEIINQINSNATSKDKAAYLFNLINRMAMGQINKDSALGSLYNPDVFLKAVNALSWQQNI